MDYSNYDISQYARGVDTATTYGTNADATAFALIGSIIATYSVVVLIIAILQIIGMWKLFSKAGEKGWKSIIPIYNMITLFKISGLSPLLILVYFATVIPFVGAIAVLVLTIYQANCLSKSFGKGTGFTLGLLFLTPIFYMILGFGNANYVGPYAKQSN